MISGQSPESRYERRQRQQNNEEIEAHLADVVLRRSIEISNENFVQRTDTDSLPHDEM